MANQPPTNAELAAQLAQLTQAVAAMAAAFQNAPAPPAATAGPVSFALSPALATGDDLLDYTTKSGSSIYKKGCEGCNKPEQVVIFEKELSDKALEQGWSVGTQAITKFSVIIDGTARELDVIKIMVKSMWPLSNQALRSFSRPVVQSTSSVLCKTTNKCGVASWQHSQRKPSPSSFHTSMNTLSGMVLMNTLQVLCCIRLLCA